MSKFEDEYLDVLQNIEFSIVSVFRNYPDTTDSDVDQAVNALIREYRAQERGRRASTLKIGVEARLIYDNVKTVCEWRLGKQSFEQEDRAVEIGDEMLLSTSEIVACLKRIRKSITRWSKQGGRQGYLRFIDQYIA